MSSAQKLFAAALLMALLAALTLHGTFRDGLDLLIAWVRAQGLSGALVFGLAYVVGTIALVPGAFLTIAAGFLYGPWWAGALVLVASVIGASLAFLLARSWFRPWVVQVISQRPGFQRLDDRVEEDGWKIVALLRLSPLVPFSVLNYVLGLTKVRFGGYVAASTIGMIPGILLYTYIGSLMSAISEIGSASSADTALAQRIVFWAGMGATVLVSILLMRWSRRSLGQPS